MTAVAHSFELPLPGLREDNPRDFLAALGLTRMFGHCWPESSPELFWFAETGTPALLVAIEPPNNWGSQLWELLCEWKRSECNPFALGRIESISSDAFRVLLSDFSPHPALVGRFFSALASQIDHPETSRRSELIIESGQRQVLKGVDDLLADPKCGQDVISDFEGTSKLRPISNSSRWNPREYRSAAYTTTDPAKTKFYDFACLNVFALLGLTFYPVVDTSFGRDTCGIRRSGKLSEFSWPIWTSPLTEMELASILNHAAIHDPGADPEILVPMGIHRVWRSRKFGDENNKYFSTASPVF